MRVQDKVHSLKESEFCRDTLPLSDSTETKEKVKQLFIHHLETITGDKELTKTLCIFFPIEHITEYTIHNEKEFSLVFDKSHQGNCNGFNIIIPQTLKGSFDCKNHEISFKEGSSIKGKKGFISFALIKFVTDSKTKMIKSSGGNKLGSFTLNINTSWLEKLKIHWTA